ncbi:hypothetical protein [Microbispora sp. NPDC049125]|uniref:hypothetical protein n=1 Tax=Microbispora sp. NPDC049125 TaxID=3154929 RepID=UPI0034666C44
MHDPAPEDAYEQTGPLVRPYITTGARFGSEEDRFWSEERDVAPRNAAPANGAPRDARAGEAAVPRVPDGDLLSDGWRDRVDEPEAYDQREAYGDPEERDVHGRDGGAALDDPDDEREPYGEERGGWDDRGPDEPATDPGGFPGAARWAELYQEDDGDRTGRSRRNGILLRTGAAAVAVAGVIWALTAWVGQPSGSSCPSGAECAAGAAVTSPAAPSGGPEGTDPGPSLPATTEPADPEPDEGPTSEPTATSGASRHRNAAPSPRATARHSATAPRPPATSAPPLPATEPTDPTQPTEAPSQPPTSAPAQPTSAPAPTQESPRHGGGLFGWLF